MARCSLCDRTNEAMLTCGRCHGVNFCDTACELEAAQQGHAARCAAIRRWPQPSAAVKKAMDDHYVLSEDVISLFRSPNWLGDENIEFFWDQVERELNPARLASDILFVPATVMMMAHFLSPQQLCEPDNFSKNVGDVGRMQLVIMPINNANHYGGGSHWGCLIYVRGLHQFRYYDSMRRSGNAQVAKGLAEKFSKALQAEGAAFVEETDAPQQENCHDCGVFAMVVGEICARFFHATGAMPGTADIANRVLTGARVPQTRVAAAERAQQVRKEHAAS